MSRILFFAGDDRGFSLPEAVMALTVLSIGILLTITPVLSGLDNLDDARLNQVASNYAQAKIEEIRSLEYADVGFPSSTPSGVLSPTESVNLEGVQFEVKTEVEYVGSVTGLNVVAGGGDGVPGSYNTGIDYKRVTVTITDPSGTMAPIVYNTIVAPPNLAAHEGLSNVILTLGRYEPVGTPTDQVSYPYPTTCLRKAGSLTQTFSSSSDPVQIYPGLDPSDPDPSDPDYYYEARLGASCDFEDGITGWRVAPASVAATDIHVAATATADVALDLYRPATLEVTVTDEFGGLLTALVTLTVDNGTTAETLLSTDPEYDAATGTFTITEFEGYPLVPGYYNLSVDAPGYLLASQLAVETPSGYPTTMTEAVTLQLIGGTGSTTTTTGATTTTTLATTTTAPTTTTTGTGPTTTTAPTTTTTAPTTTTTTVTGTTINYAPAGEGVAAQDSATYSGYIMYSAESVHTRWTANSPFYDNSDHFIAVVYSGGWYYDNNSFLVPFTPRSTDILVAQIDAAADTAVLLAGVNSTVSGIQAGYISGSLTVTPNQYRGSSNMGEWGIGGTSFVAWPPSGGGTNIVTYDVDVEDWLGWDIHGATVTFEGGSLTGPQTATTDENGDVSIDLIDGDLLTMTVTSPYGHETYTTSVLVSGDASLSVTLNRPSGYGGIKFYDANATDIATVGFGPWGTNALDLTEVLLNADGQATAAVWPGWWSTAGYCASGSVNFTENRRVNDQYDVENVDVDAEYSYWRGCS